MENEMSTNQGQTSIERVCPKCGNVLKKEWRVWTACGGTTVQKDKVSHGFAAASIVFSLIGFFFAGIIFGFIGLGLGLEAMKNKDALGLIGFILGIIVVILAFSA